jgi:nitrate/nitrite transporter NarK
MKKRNIIFHSIILFYAYCSDKVIGVFGNYAKDVGNYSLEEVTYFAIFIQYLRSIAAISIGWIADKYLPSKIILPSFSVLIFASTVLDFEFVNAQTVFLSFTIFIFMALETYSLRGLYFVIIEEIKRPFK